MEQIGITTDYDGWSPAAAHAWTAPELKLILAEERKRSPFLVTKHPESRRILLHSLSSEQDGTPLTVGRGSEVDLDLSGDSEVSRSHCRLERVGGAWTVSDDGLSRNGTFVNAERLTGVQRLVDRDVLKCGRTLILFRDPERGNTTVTSFSTEAVTAQKASEAQMRVLEALARPCLGEKRFVAPATNKEIAEELFISLDTVKTHLRALFSAFGLEDVPQNQKRAKLVEMAIGAGLVRDVESDSAD